MKRPLKTILSVVSIFCLYLATPAALAGDHLIRSSEDGSVTHIFNLPACLPSCTRADQDALATSSATEAAIVAAINRAERSVQFSQYTFSRKPVFDALIAASTRGVQIQGVVDKGQLRSLADVCTGNGCSQLPPPFNSDGYLRATVGDRIAVASDVPLYRDATNSEKLAILLAGSSDDSGMKFLGGSRLVHHKFVLVDGRTLLSGSGNWSSTAVSVNLENLTISEDSVDTQPFACIFASMWGDASQRTQAAAACQTENVFFSPVGTQADRIVRDITRSTQEARQTIDIAMHHLVHPSVLAELTKAAQRGVRVRIATDDDLCLQKMTPEMRELIAAGAERRYVPTSCSLFQLAHNKFAVFDQRKLINGSGNWSKAGLERNFENFKSSINRFDVETFQEAFDRVWATSVARSACSCDPSQAACRERYCLDRDR